MPPLLTRYGTRRVECLREMGGRCAWAREHRIRLAQMGKASGSPSRSKTEEADAYFRKAYEANDGHFKALTERIPRNPAGCGRSTHLWR